MRKAAGEFRFLRMLASLLSPATNKASSYRRQLRRAGSGLCLHHPEETPCGEPIGVAEAHTLIDLSEVKALSPKNSQIN
jgi:hypothetical protein